MRQCHFCSRWFRNRQGVRRHLGYCSTYRAVRGPVSRSVREPLFQCQDCVATFGAALVAKVTRDEMHAQHSQHRGCAVCGKDLWVDAGWKLMPAGTPTGQ